MPRRFAIPALTALALLLVACGGDGAPSTTAELGPGSLLLADYPVYFDEQSGLRTILGTPDLAIGRQRVGFVLSDDDGLIRLPVTSVASFRYPNGEDGAREGPVQEGRARFFEFPYGVRGIYVIELDFDRAGQWGLEVTVPRPDGSVTLLAFTFPVAERALTPTVGDPAPRSDSRTLRDVTSINELTTGSEPNPALYEQSIAEAVAAGRPLVVVFASPAFCTNALCGPQVEVLGELQARYGDRASFIHVDLYENPHEIQGDLARGVRTPILEEWGIETDEWTFIVDERGNVAARFEAFVTRAELEDALLRVVDPAVAQAVDEPVDEAYDEAAID
jgi:hypothetical protein